MPGRTQVCAGSLASASSRGRDVEAWQIFILVFSTIVPIVLLGAREPWADDRLTFRGRPTQRDWKRQVEPSVEDDGHH